MSKSILTVSSRTVHKILKRANVGCSICGWNDATCDLHHIIEVSQGGTDDMENLIILCPNCHRTVHVHGDSFKTHDDLRLVSMAYTLPNWEDFYNTHIPSKNYSTVINLCKHCGTDTGSKNVYCSTSCINAATHRRTGEWNEDSIREILSKFNGNLTKCGAHLNVSDNAFKKQCKKYNIDISEYRTTYKRKANYDISYNKK